MFNLDIKDDSVSITGITSVGDVNDKTVSVKLKDRSLLVSGSGLSVTKLDVEQGSLFATGKVSQVKFGAGKGAEGFLKKLVR